MARKLINRAAFIIAVCFGFFMGIYLCISALIVFNKEPLLGGTFLLFGIASLFLCSVAENQVNSIKEEGMQKPNDDELPANLTDWLDNNTIVLTSSYVGEEVIPVETVSEKLHEILDGNYQPKAEILFEIVKPHTDKTLREITTEELRELALNFKEGL